jgi:hypothetical protein
MYKISLFIFSYLHSPARGMVGQCAANAGGTGKGNLTKSNLFTNSNRIIQGIIVK